MLILRFVPKAGLNALVHLEINTQVLWFCDASNIDGDNDFGITDDVAAVAVIGAAGGDRTCDSDSRSWWSSAKIASTMVDVVAITMSAFFLVHVISSRRQTHRTSTLKEGSMRLSRCITKRFVPPTHPPRLHPVNALVKTLNPCVESAVHKLAYSHYNTHSIRLALTVMHMHGC